VPSPQQYCTLFDRNYLARALALYRSLERCCERFVLRGVCMDEESRGLLDKLSLPHMRTIPIAEVEAQDPELRAARATRSPMEYCWTCTPAICRFILRHEPDLDALTYLDADLCFWSSPAPLLAELDEGSILLVPHRNTGAFDANADIGIYNVGWITFRNDVHGRTALDWWRERCVEWCYDRFEPGRYGDQKYLDDWPARFPGVKVTSNPGAGMAPWNDGRYSVTAPHEGRVLVDGAPLIYYHHAGLRVHAATRLSRFLARWTRPNRVTGRLAWTVLVRPPEDTVLDVVWAPYLARLSEAHGELAAVGASASVGLNRAPLRVALSQVARQSTPPAVVDAYRRIPSFVRHRIGRTLSPP
jgi:hypothetical protein